MTSALYLGDMADVVHDQAELIYADLPFNTGKSRKAGSHSYEDSFGSPEDYIAWLSPRLSHMKDLSSGNVIVHVDAGMSHYVKCELDRIFGLQHFRNEIIWSYASGGASKRALAKKHDVLLWYTVTPNYPFTILREPYSPPLEKERAGFHPDGRMLTDVWPMSILSTTASERVGYPTQKPLKLMDRIVQIFSTPGSLVADHCCGSGTTLVAARRLGREVIGVDMSMEALNVAAARLEAEGDAVDIRIMLGLNHG